MNQPIRILHWGLTEGCGGIEAFIMDLYRHIDRKKVQFDFLENHSMKKFIYENEINQMGGRVFRVLYSQREDYKKSKNCLIDFLKKHPEIVGIHVHANFLYAKLLKDAKKAGLPIRILHSHNSGVNRKESLKEKFRSIFVRRQISRYPSVFFTCSDLAANFMFPNKEYKWIKNGINTEKYDYNLETRIRIRNYLGIGDETLIGFVGNLRMQKNPYYLIDIFEQFHKKNTTSKLLVIGSGVLEEDIKKYVLSKKLDDAVLFTGLVSNVHEMYQAMDAFLLPSLYEGLPVVLVEAQTSGLPCFAADSITKQICVTENIRYISINEEPSQWAEIIFNTLSNYKRESNRKQIIDAGFDMKDVAFEVQNYYLSHYNDRND